MNQRGSAPAIILVITLAIGLLLIFVDNRIDFNPKDKDKEDTNNVFQPTKLATDKKTPEKKEREEKLPTNGICERYTSYEIQPSEFLRTYKLDSGDTLEVIAMREYGTTEMAESIKDVNNLMSDSLYGFNIYLPEEGFDYKRVKKYFIYYGNFAYETKEKNSFTVKQPRAAITSLIVTKKVQELLGNIKEDDCVYVIYGTNLDGYGTRVFDVGLQ